jgi:hypothetical protein
LNFPCDATRGNFNARKASIIGHKDISVIKSVIFETQSGGALSAVELHPSLRLFSGWKESFLAFLIHFACSLITLIVHSLGIMPCVRSRDPKTSQVEDDSTGELSSSSSSFVQHSSTGEERKLIPHCWLSLLLVFFILILRRGMALTGV